MNTTIEVGDIVKGISDKYNITNRDMTRATVTRVESDWDIALIVTEHKYLQWVGRRFSMLSAEKFEIIGHVKPFDRDAVRTELESGNKAALYEYDLRGADLRDADLRDANLCRANLSDADLRDADLRDANLCRANLRGANLGGAYLREANLRGADLRGADLRGAELDYSCLPLWCGSLHMKIDKRLACQIAYHLCSVECDDPEYIEMRNSILRFANQFHRVDECGILEERAVPEPKEDAKEDAKEDEKE